MPSENQNTFDQPAKSLTKLRWYQYSLRTMLICSFIFALACSWVGVKIRQAQAQKEIAEKLRKAGCSIYYYGGDPFPAHSPDASCPYPHWLRSLVGDDFLSNVVILIYGSSKFNPEFTNDDFALMERFDHLRHICINADITDEAIAHIKTLVNLEDIELMSTQITDIGLANLEPLSKLRQLSLGCNRITDVGIKHLEGLKLLQELDYDHGNAPISEPISDAGMASIGHLTNLKNLLLRHSVVTDAGLVHLENLVQLERIVLHSSIKGDGLVHLQKLEKLRYLALSGSQISDGGLRHLAVLPNLDCLILEGTSISDKGLAHLAGLTSLRRLYLINTQITDNGLIHLVGLTNLDDLSLYNSQISDSGLIHLRSLKNLHRLSIEGTQVTDQGISELKKALPRVDVSK
jgi:hypothetical protein